MNYCSEVYRPLRNQARVNDSCAQTRLCDRDNTEQLCGPGTCSLKKGHPWQLEDLKIGHPSQGWWPGNRSGYESVPMPGVTWTVQHLCVLQSVRQPHTPTNVGCLLCDAMEGEPPFPLGFPRMWNLQNCFVEPVSPGPVMAAAPRIRGWR